MRSTRGRRSEVASEAIASAEGACRGPEWSGGAGGGWLWSRRPRAPRPRRGEGAASARARAGHCSHPFLPKKEKGTHQQPASWGQPQGTLGGIWGREGRHDGGVPTSRATAVDGAMPHWSHIGDTRPPSLPVQERGTGAVLRRCMVPPLGGGGGPRRGGGTIHAACAVACSSMRRAAVRKRGPGSTTLVSTSTDFPIMYG